MSFQIINIILYSNTGETRILPFHTNSVNIITGASKTGKSALIHIVNYCLGQKKSNIPDGVILESVSWFAVHLVKGEDELIIARLNPGSGRLSSENIYIERGHNLDVPDYDTLKQNINREGLIELLNKFAGISEYAFEPKSGHTRTSGIAHIGKALIYCFQEQSEVANQRLLFHRQGEQFLPQSIKDYMPFFLGVVDKEHLLNNEKVRILKQDLRKQESQIAERKRLKGSFFEKAHALITEGIYVGLLPASLQMPHSWIEVKAALRNAVNSRIEQDIPEAQYTEKLNSLFDMKKHMWDSYKTAAEEIVALRALKSGGDGFTQESKEQRARLKSIGLLPIDEKADYHTCPLCSSILEHPTPDFKNIHTNLQNISKQLDGVTSDLSHIEKMITMAEAKQNEEKLELQSINAQIHAIQKMNQQIDDIRDSNAKRAFVQGRLGLYLETIVDVEDETADNSDIEMLRSRIMSLEELLDIDALEERLNSVLSVLSDEITGMARRLNIEHSSHPIRLDLKKLTVVADTESGPLPLERMGSCENWVSLHLITHLVLHRWFTRKNLPVPRFVFFDQPTQAYFPPEVTDETVRNSDMESVIQMFQLIIDSVRDAGFQVIITEHADIQESWYQEMVINKWWDGTAKLVPLEWIEDN
ncbi:MAG: DUF3732 domain-containing protein [Erysipelotrichaceae bacterium]|nr:DUF3732 domain-containing protein [Erysipelotrichaceae bacterium]